MSKPNNHDPEAREERWVAYSLGELGQAERREVEAELEADPAAKAQYQRLVEGIAQWAEEPVPFTPLDIAALDLDPAHPAATPSGASFWDQLRSLLPTGPLAWSFVSAAAILIALTQVEFSVPIGSGTFHWGRSQVGQGADQNLLARIDGLSNEIRALETVAAANSGQIERVSLEQSVNDVYLDTQIREAATQLVNLQQIETQTRYRDVQFMMDLFREAGLTDSTELEWMQGDLISGPPARGTTPNDPTTNSIPR